MFSPSKRVLNEYKPLIMKVAQDTATINTTKVNHELLCDVETLLGFTCIFPLLEIVQGFSKFAQPRCAIFIHDYVSIIKLAKVDLQTMYCDPNFRSSYYLISPSSMMLWWTQVETLIDYVAFYFRSKLYETIMCFNYYWSHNKVGETFFCAKVVKCNWGNLP